MRRGFGLRLNGFRGSRRAFRLSRLRPPRPTVAPKSSSKLTLRWSERDSKSRSRRQRNGRGEGARSNPSVAIGPELDAETGGRSGPPSGTLGDYSRERDRELDRTRAKSGMAARLDPKAPLHGLPYATSQHHSCPSRCPPSVPSRGVPDRRDSEQAFGDMVATVNLDVGNPTDRRSSWIVVFSGGISLRPSENT